VIWRRTAQTGAGLPGILNFVSAKSSTGFSGIAKVTGGGAAANTTLTFYYWASVPSSVDVDEDYQFSEYLNNYRHRGAQTNVTTDSSGNATINYSDFVTDEFPTAAFVNSCDTPSSSAAAGIVVTSVGEDDVTIHVGKRNGTDLASTSTCVDYVAVGDQGGADSPHDINSASAGGLYYQEHIQIELLPPPAHGLEFTECGDTIWFPQGDLSCLRWATGPSFNSNRNYKFDSTFSNMPDVGGVSMEEHFEDAVVAVEAADFRGVNWSETANSEDLLVTADTLSGTTCAQTGWSWDNNTMEDGLPWLTHADIAYDADHDFVVALPARVNATSSSPARTSCYTRRAPRTTISTLTMKTWTATRSWSRLAALTCRPAAAATRFRSTTRSAWPRSTATRQACRCSSGAPRRVTCWSRAPGSRSASSRSARASRRSRKPPGGG
jgi:hypothetical protein